MRREGLWAIIGGLLLAAGLLVGYVPVHSSSGENCGSPFASNVNTLRLSGSLSGLGSAYSGSGNGDLGFGDAAAECESKHNGTRPIAILLIALGAVGLLAAGVANGVAAHRDSAPSERPASG